jgi:hypothetical protein
VEFGEGCFSVDVNLFASRVFSEELADPVWILEPIRFFQQSIGPFEPVVPVELFSNLLLFAEFEQKGSQKDQGKVQPFTN